MPHSVKGARLERRRPVTIPEVQNLDGTGHTAGVASAGGGEMSREQRTSGQRAAVGDTVGGIRPTTHSPKPTEGATPCVSRGPRFVRMCHHRLINGSKCSPRERAVGDGRLGGYPAPRDTGPRAFCSFRANLKLL